MLASTVTRTLTEVPGFAGVPVVIRKLAGRHLESARLAKGEKVLEAFRKIREFQKEIESASPETPKAAPVEVVPTPAQAVEAVLEEFDRYVVVAKGLVSIDGKPAPADVADDLGDDELAYFHEQILRLSVPRRFATADEAEAARKNA